MPRIGLLSVGLGYVVFCLATEPSSHAQTGACCLDGGVCISVTQANCASALPPGAYQGNGAACPGSCAQQGACCFTDGSCDEQYYGPCTASTGTFQGNTTTCSPNPCPPPAQVPTQINHQGVVSVNGQRFNGNGSFYFAIVDPGTSNSIWTNDATNIGTANLPNQPVTIACVNGLYDVRLGDTSLANMKSVPVAVFASETRSLRIWFDDGTNGIFQLTPDHPLTTVPYTFRAAESGRSGQEGAKFGGSGIDGDLSIAAGTTNIDLGGANIVVRNYRSISITGNGSITFTNPHANGTIIVFKSQGAVTLTSSTTPMIDLRNLGATGGTGFSWPAGDGAAGSDAIATVGTSAGGSGGVIGGNTTGGVGFNRFGTLEGSISYGKVFPLFAGAGGGGGATSSGSSGGAGGRGAGGLYVECGGALNFTTVGGISIAGTAGTNGSGGINSGGGGGGNMLSGSANMSGTGGAGAAGQSLIAPKSDS